MQPWTFDAHNASMKERGSFVDKWRISVFGNFDANSPEIKALVQNTSETELTELLVSSLKELWRNPAQLAQFLNTLPPFVREQLKSMPPSDEMLRPMARMTAQMLRSEVNGGGGKSDIFQQARALMGDPKISQWMNSLVGGAPGEPVPMEEEPPAQWTELMSSACAAAAEGDSDEAEHCFIEALQMMEQTQPDSLCLYETIQHLSSFYLSEERFDEAEPFLKMWLKRGEQRFGADHAILTGAYAGLASVREYQNKTSDAELLYTKCLNIADKALKDQPEELSAIRENIASFYERRKIYNKSDPLFKSSIQLRQQANGEGLELAEQVLRYALILLERGAATEAKAYVDGAMLIKEKALDYRDPDLHRSRSVLGAVHLGIGNLDEAERILTASVDALEEIVEEQEDLLYPMEQLKKLHEARGNADQVKKLENRLSEIKNALEEESDDEQ